MMRFLILLFPVLCFGQGFAVQSLQVGSPIIVSPENNVLMTISGTTATSTVTSGPEYGDRNKCGFGYRVTGEAVDPAAVWRCNGYIFEDTLPEWLVAISKQGTLIVGSVWPPVPMYATAPLDVRGEIKTQGLHRSNANAQGDSAICFFNKQEEAKWCIGMIPSITQSGEDLIIARYKYNTWMVMQRYGY